MLMVIFGAGASYDSSPTYPVEWTRPTNPIVEPPNATSIDRANHYNRPPLAKDLFENRPLFIECLDAFPQCKTIVPRLRHASDSRIGSVEAILEEIQQEAVAYSRGAQEIAAVRCYLQRAISECERLWRETTRGVTNHLALLREIERTSAGRPVCLVTFNYDTLLETALADLDPQYAIRSIEDYTNPASRFQLFKLHGSVNWANEITSTLPLQVNPSFGQSVLQYVIDHANEVEISTETLLCNPNSMGASAGRAVFPAIAIPIEKKQVFQCPDRMVEALAGLLPQITQILAIGWRASEQHFLDLLRRNLRAGTTLWTVAGSIQEAEETRVTICKALLNNPARSLKELCGFTSSMRNREFKQILG